MQSKKICFVITAEFVVRAFLLNHLRALSKIYVVTVIVNTQNSNFLAELGINVQVIPIKISRDINLCSDLYALFKLIQLFKKQSYDAVHSITPKAGLLAMIAGALTKTPLRVHTFTGQVWATKTGFSRYILKKVDAIFAGLATHLIIDSPSQLDFLLCEKVVKKDKCYVFGRGSVSGVDLTRFVPDLSAKLKTKSALNIPSDAFIFLFLGRLTKDKGVIDLATAFNQLSNNSAYLLIVGPDEQNIKNILEIILAEKKHLVRYVGYTNRPEEFMNASDVLVLPSYREGFGTVVIEAAALGVPTIASRIYGLVDTIDDNETGILHECKNISEIQKKMDLIYNNIQLRIKLGQNARTRVLKYFDSSMLTQKWVEFYSKNLSSDEII